MATTLKTETKSAKKQATREYQEPKRLSKAGQWRRDNPGGIGYIIVDRRAVNR